MFQVNCLFDMECLYLVVGRVINEVFNWFLIRNIIKATKLGPE